MTEPLAAADRDRHSHARKGPVAALLSFLFPGLGQLYNGQPWLAVALALPLVIVIATAAALAVGAGRSLIGVLFDTDVLMALLVLNGLLLAWRLVSIVQAHARRAPLALNRAVTYPTAFLVLAAVLMHLVSGWYTVQAIETLDAVALGGDGGGGDAPRSAYRELVVAAPSSEPNVESGERVNVLLIGIDELPGREAILTDTMLVVSLDPDTGRTAMLSVPRDLYGAPLPDGGTYDDKLNSLMTVASADPERYPRGGIGTLKATIGELLGVPIHYFAAINLLGFKKAVDAVGGVDIEVEQAVSDAHYFDEYDVNSGFFIEPGLHHMDGRTALGYVRSRQGEGDTDFTRAARQQKLLTALGEKLTAGNVLRSLPALLDAVQNTIATDIPSERMPALAEALERADISATERAVLEPPNYVTPATGPGGAYILVPDLTAIRRLGQELLSSGDGDPRYAGHFPPDRLTSAGRCDARPATGSRPTRRDSVAGRSPRLCWEGHWDGGDQAA